MPENSRGKARGSIVVVLILLVVTIGASVPGARAIMTTMSQMPPAVTTCWDIRGIHTADTTATGVSSDFYQCAAEQASLFFKVDYAETKDLIKEFFTLVTAVLVASITFSEKIIDLDRAGAAQRGLMILCWVLLFSAIFLSGAGLVFLTTAAGWANHSPLRDFHAFDSRAYHLVVLAGVAFGGGLAALLAAGVFSVVRRPVPAAEVV